MERRTAARTSTPKNKPRASHERGAGTDAEIVRVATKLFRERGYHGTSMGDVAAVIGVTAASLYYHFEGKQDLLLRVLRDGMDTFLESLEEIAQADLAPDMKLDRAVVNHLAFVLQRSDAVAVFLRERRFLDSPHAEQYEPRVDRYDELFTSIVSEVVAERLPDVDPKLMSMLVLGTINSIVEWYRPGGRYGEAELAATVAHRVERMFAPQSGPA